jgi:hypothetical protein
MSLNELIDYYEKSVAFDAYILEQDNGCIIHFVGSLSRVGTVTRRVQFAGKSAFTFRYLRNSSRES